ncbi:type VII secretion protein EssC [Enterococcus ureilyticus]|uniref:Type VII secretion protein EssC n=1 Tax=Enterococcus ureilyticus TaxID=1131292 RepID=A0A1E5HC85_9ENTE|nr:type VII secretion protein EssC [Enterococcus ureilyticus]MBM7690361.1 S-DNA-T family DNA segregation ATPase FtsK/SpoIIIE [Enterococcus ureilyticus]OEG22562.1 type VII secretion protein EssC [Enterococcus ureilyticus]
MTQTQAILYLQGYRYQLLLDEEKVQRIGSDNQASLHLPLLTEVDELTIEMKEEWILTHQGQEQVLSLDSPLILSLSDEQQVTVILAPVTKMHVFDLLDKKELILSTDKGATLELPKDDVTKTISAILKKQEDQWLLTVLSGELMINNQLFTGTDYLLGKGDELSFLHHTLKVFTHEIHATEGTIIKSDLCEIYTSRYDVYEDYPDFHRSPRIIYREPEEKITINAPSEPNNKQQDQLIKTILPPIVMLMVTVAMAFFRPNGLFVLASAATTLITIIFSITNYFKTKKEHKQSLIDREVSYKKYLVDKSVELHQLNQEQKQGQLYHYPNVSELLEMTKTYSPRIYEKTALHFDFLFYRLGLGTLQSSSDITYSNKERGKETDDLEKSGYELYTKSLELEDMPIVANLVNGPVGYIGPRNLVLEQLHLLVNQLSVFHSYHDLQFISIFPEAEKDQWEWMRWLPHATMQDVNVRGFVYNQRSRDQVLNSLNQILKNRKNSMEENRNSRDSTIFSPHYVVMITDEKLILDHVIMEFFNEDPSELGCSVIFVEDVMSSLSDNIKTVIDIRDRNTGVLLLEEGKLKNTPFQLDHFPADFSKEQLPRLLAPLNHLQNLKSSIPEAVTFLEMYGIEKFDEFNVTQRWAEHSPHKTLAVPLGLRGKDDIVYLNLHEKAHGPHGLVAGTTGSGKSEIVQSYILSLAVNFHPYDVAFLLIDYKGGGMANLFRNLPHLLGSITNLDGAQSMRALISINAELKRRQRLFSENNVNHINQYQKLYKSGDVEEPMPHLFLISDEFAELKSEQPEFMKELVSTARIGRSLGIHLILATQKPSGVVNDQIWSNSKFKLALKVADKADSMEMLKTPDAAEITQAGRAYLQVGNNEIYELFQSAWSGADYQPEKDDQQIEDHTIYLVNDLGQYEILSEDLSGLENADDVKQIPTELDAIIDGIHEVAERENITPLPRPWLPPLEERIASSTLHPVDFREEWLTEKQPLEPVLGVVDVPSMQAQNTLRLNMTQEGHMTVFSSPGYGKSTFMQTVVMDLARVHSPERLNVYLLDFGTNGLLPLKKLPHVADTMSIDEEEKIEKFARRINDELKRRKKLLSEFSVASLDMYERASGKEEPIILILLDGFEGLKDAKFNEILEKVITQVAREGAGIGVHLLLSAGRQNSLKAILSSNIKTQIVLKMIDDSEPRAIVGRTTLTIDDLPGRGLIKLEEPELFQAALPADGEDTLQIIEAIQEEVNQMDQHWTGARPEPIPMVPEILTEEYFINMPSVQRDLATPNLFPVGIDFEEVQSVSWDSYRSNLLFTYGKIQEAEQFGKQLLSQLLQKEHQVILLDTANSPLYELHDKVSALATEKEQYHDLLNALKIRLEEREEQYAIEREKQGPLSPTEFYRGLKPMYILLNNVNKVVSEMDTLNQTLLVKLLTEAHQVGIYFVSIADIFELSKGYDDISKVLKRAEEVILTVRLNDQSIFSPSNKNYKEPMLAEDEAYYLINNMAYLLKQCK